MKDLELSHGDLHNIDIKFEGRDGLITGNIGDVVPKINKSVISFLVGTVNNGNHKEDEYKIKIKFNHKQDVIRLQLLKYRGLYSIYEIPNIKTELILHIL
ncbi:hypothetical protein [Lysinibacillus sp. NPDC047702]|uniref:hypothetical protein n=1 Tax=unclassified Lysinibacillus TaxID=2636778 RepID=UPI003CFD29A3